METLDECFKKTLHPDDVIINAFEKKRLVVFVGAGVSRLMGLPGWDEFSNKLIKGAYKDYKEQQSILKGITNSKEKITIAYNKYCKDKRERDFFKEFGEALKPKDKKGNIYKILSKFNATFLTTNADGLFENELKKDLCHTDLDIKFLNTDTFRETNHLFYLHGKYIKNSIKNNRNLVFTASAYVKKYTDPKTVKFLQTLFEKDNVIVFVGYGLNEFELIDYIMTKTGVTQSTGDKNKSGKGKEKVKNVYMLEGFCSNQEELFQARKSYFDDLGIELCPYCLDVKGYEALNDILKSWVNDFDTKTNLPAVIGTDIENYIRTFSESNVAHILHIINVKQNSLAIDNKIVQEVFVSKDKDKWVNRFILEGLFSYEKLKQAIECRQNEMPYWHLLMDELLSQNESVQDAATNLINDIIKSKVQFQQENIYIVSCMVQLILRLDNKHAKIKHLNIISKAVKLYGYRVFYFDQKIKLPMLGEWRKELVNGFLKILTTNLKAFDAYNDLNYHYYAKIMSELNNQISKDCLPLIVDWLEQMFDVTTKAEPYCLLSRIWNIDNVKKAHYPYWDLLIGEYRFALNQLPIGEKENIAKKLFDSKNIALNKLALYTCRTYNLDPNMFVAGILQVMSNYKCYCELYMYLKEQSKILTEDNSEKILNKIKVSEFGYEDYSAKDTLTLQNIETKRLTLAMVLPKSETYVEELMQKGIEVNDPIDTADACDYPHITQLKVDSMFNFDALHQNDFVAELKNMLAKANNIWHGNIIEKAIEEVLLEKDIKTFKNVLEEIRDENEELINGFVLHFYIIRNRLNEEQKETIYEFCLDLLSKFNGQMITLTKHCFNYLSSMGIVSDAIAAQVGCCLKTWCKMNLPTEYLQANDVWASFINTVDYSIFGLLMRYLIYKRESRREILGEADILVLTEYLYSNASARYCLSFNLPHLFYIFGKTAVPFLEQLVFNNNRFNMHALMFCTLNGNFVYEEVISFIQKHNIVENHLTEIGEYVDKRMLERFYSYLMTGYFSNLVNKKTLMMLTQNNNFVNCYLHNIGIYHEQPIFDFDVHICEFYHEVRLNLSKDALDEVCSCMLHLLRYMENPTDCNLNTYLQVMDDINHDKYAIVDVEKLLLFFDLDFEKAFQMVQSFIKKVQYCSTSDIEKIIMRMKELNKKSEGYEFLNLCYEKFTESIDVYKHLSALLE